MEASRAVLKSVINFKSWLLLGTLSTEMIKLLNVRAIEHYTNIVFRMIGPAIKCARWTETEMHAARSLHLQFCMPTFIYSFIYVNMVRER